MLVSDFLDTIYDNVATKQDYLNKSVAPIFTNDRICRQLKFALDKYASYTKALEAYHTLSVAGNDAEIMYPDYMIRSEGIRFLVWFINGYAYPIMDKNLNNTYGNFPTVLQGLPRWFNCWEDRIDFYPQNSNGYNHTTITANVSTSDTTIEVASTSGFKAKNGRFTLDNEKIAFQYKDATHFYGCRRGMEDTTPLPHNIGAVLNENNVWVYYRRLHFPIMPKSDGTMSSDLLAKEMMIADDHLEVVADYVTYKLLSKIDTERAQYYKVNFDEWLKEAKYDINKGRAAISKSSNIRDPYLFETNDPVWRM